MTQTKQDIVSVQEIVKDFRPGFGLTRKRILHGISFDVKEGEIFGFVGPNGAGKTTTLKILMGLIHASSGSASILGHQVEQSAYRKLVGFLPENPSFYDYLTGNEFLDFYAKVGGVPASERPGRVETLLREVGLEGAGEERLRAYSKGMLQRIGIAQAIIHDPMIVFLDEPMSGLDPIGRKEVRDLILRLNQQGKTIFMNTHILSDVEMVCHRVAILVKGRIRYVGAVEQFLNSGTRTADVVLARLPADAGDALEERFDCQVHGRGDRIEVQVPEKSLSDLLQLALSWEADVVSVTPHRESLESLFMTAVNEDAQEEAR